MRAAEFDRYGDVGVLRVREVPAPSPRRGEVLVAVEAAAINPKDVIIRRGRFAAITGRRFPRRTGYDWAGRVVATGAGVTDLARGDEVFGMINDWAGGAVAERVCVARGELARKPARWTWEEAAATPLAALTALQALRDVAGLRAGQRTLIHGASGGVGGFAIQLARSLGAHVITTSSAANAALCRELGAHEALDYRDGAALSALRDLDCWFDVFGNHAFPQVAARLGPRGVFVSTVPKPHVFAWILRTALARRRCRLVVVRSRADDLAHLAALGEAGRLRAVIDSTWPLDAVAEAHARVETRRARGKVVVRIAR